MTTTIALLVLIVAVTFLFLVGLSIVGGAAYLRKKGAGKDAASDLGPMASVLTRLEKLNRGEVKPAAMEPEKNRPPLEAITSPLPEDRLRAAEELGKAKNPNTVETLLAALQDENVDVRSMAAWALSEIKDVRAIDPLIQALPKDLNGKIATAVCQMGSAAVDPLIHAMEDGREDIKKKAQILLKRIQDPHSEESLVASLSDDDSATRIHASWELKGLIREKKTPAILEALLASLNDVEAEVRNNCAEALGEIKEPRAVDPLMAALKDPLTLKSAARSLGEIKDARAIPALLKIMADPDKQNRECAAAALARIGAPSVEPLLGLLGAADLNTRENAIWALGEIKDPKAIAPLGNLLKDRAMMIRARAAESLGQIKAGVPTAPLLEALKDEKPLVRVKAIESLAALRKPEVVGAIIPMINDANAYVRDTAAVSLGALKDPHAVDPLLALLSEKPTPSIYQALQAITGNTFSSYDAWREWWRYNRDALLHGG